MMTLGSPHPQKVYTRDIAIKKPEVSSAKRTTGLCNSVIGSAPLAISEEATVMEACQLMASKRVDALLVVNHPIKMGLTGIFTDKDLTYRVVAEGLDPRSTTLSQVMTPHPVTFPHSKPISEGLQIMIEKHFRHLPVVDDITGAIVGLLDITQCMKEALETMEKADKMARTLSTALDITSDSPQDLNTLDPILLQASQLAGLLRDKFVAPTLSTIFAFNQKPPPILSLKNTILEAAKLMKLSKETAILLIDESKNDSLVGIITSKDIVIRVIAACLDPSTISLVRVMTPHPDTVNLETTVLQALKKMHAGHYLHLPVLDGNMSPFGLVDVLQLTLTILEQIHSMEQKESVNPFQQIWSNPFFADSPTISSMNQASIRVVAPPSPSSNRHQNASQDEDDRFSSVSNDKLSNVTSIAANKYMAKVKGPHGAVLISFREGQLSYEQLVDDLRIKFSIPIIVSLRICYRDDEDDLVLISSTSDLETAFEQYHGKIASTPSGTISHRLTLTAFAGGVSLEEWSVGKHLNVKTDVEISSSIPSPAMSSIAVSNINENRKIVHESTLWERMRKHIQELSGRDWSVLACVAAIGIYGIMKQRQ